MAKTNTDFKNEIANILNTNGYTIQNYYMENEIGAIATKEYETAVGKKEAQIVLTLHDSSHKISLDYHSERNIYCAELIPTNSTSSQLENIIKDFIKNSDELINKSYARGLYLNDIRRANLENLNNHVVQFFDNQGKLHEGMIVNSVKDENTRDELVYFYEIETAQGRFCDIPEGDIERVIYQSPEELKIHEMISSIKNSVSADEYNLLSKEQYNSKLHQPISDEIALNKKYLEFLTLESNTLLAKKEQVDKENSNEEDLTYEQESLKI